MITVHAFDTVQKSFLPFNIMLIPYNTTWERTMTQSTLLFAYEINAQVAKKMLQKQAGFAAKFKKFKASEIVDHVTKCWEELEKLFNSQDISPSDKILYTIRLQDPLRIGKNRNDIVNNAFLMSVISDDTRFGREAIDGARFYQYSENSDFEKNQFSILLEELKDNYSTQEVGVFGWVNVPSDSIDSKMKQIAVEFSRDNNGELHFIEISGEGKIFPNFSNVSSQKFEGKLAGNYSLTLSVNDYGEGIDRLNSITNTVVRKHAIKVTENAQSGVQDVVDMEEPSKSKKSYTDDFKIEVAKAAQEDGATLASVGDRYGVSPTLVRNWKIKFSDDGDNAKTTNGNQPNIEISALKSWIQSAAVAGTIDSDGDLYVSLETSEDTLNDDPVKLFLIGKQKLASGSKSETFEFNSELTTNEMNWLRSDFLKGVGTDNPQFSFNLDCDVRTCSENAVVPLVLKKGKVSECPIKVGDLAISELQFIPDDDGFRAEGILNGSNGFIYASELLTSEPEEGHSTTINKVMDDENSTEIYEYLWDVKEGDTVYLILNAYENSIGHLNCGYTGTAQIEEPVQYDDDDDYDHDEFEQSDFEDVETTEGDVGLFEFQIKRGYVDGDAIEEDEIQELATKLKDLCEAEDFEAASKLLMASLSFEFGPADLDDEPEKYFSDLDYIDFECSDENTSVKVGVDGDGDLLVTITVQFEIALNAGISTSDLQDYLPDSGAWAAASASPGWGYYESDGENVRFLGLKGDAGSNDGVSDSQSDDIPDSFEGTVHAITIKRAAQISDFGCLSASNHSMDGPELTFYLVNDFNTEDYHLVLEGESYYLASVEEFDWEAPKYALSNIKQKLQQTFSITDEQTEQLIFYIQANVTDEADDLDEAKFTHNVAECGEVNGEDHFNDEEDAANRIWISTGQNLSGIDVKIDAENFSIQFDHECLEEKEVASWSKFKLNASPKSAAKKSVLDLTDQPIGSVEFKIEVASACAESGMNYKDFAQLYNLNADELNAWGVEFLGANLDVASRQTETGDGKVTENLVKIDLEITQHVLKKEVNDYNEFIEVFEDAEPYFIEDSFEHLNVNSVSFDFQVGKCKEHDETYSREIKCSISFSVSSIDELKEFLTEEYILDEGDFGGNRFIAYYIGNIDSINVGEDEDGDFISIEIEETEVNGSISFGS